MADKELRKMNRTELIEIIYALQQREITLREENKQLTDKLNDRLLRVERAGSIADAALSVNQIFMDAQDAADQYVESVQLTAGNEYHHAVGIVADAHKRADAIIAEAESRAREICPAVEAATEETEVPVPEAAEDTDSGDRQPEPDPEGEPAVPVSQGSAGE